MADEGSLDKLSGTPEDECANQNLDFSTALNSKVNNDSPVGDGDMTNILVDMACNPPIGLSTDDVNRRIITLLTVRLYMHSESVKVALESL
ncbi:hypothetical protein X943_004038 [Babesia divergens]|uniref:Uncharacterized protein n=1 Tax=Babesia divergens TaxID=32595 RepID=A0AAD9G808_BABDI|nr:hypothetical protein X943_004038 [Babesia divergens]